MVAVANDSKSDSRSVIGSYVAVGTASPRASATLGPTVRWSAGPTGSRYCSRIASARGRLRVRQPRRARKAARPDRGRPAHPGQGDRSRPGLLQRGRQRHHPPRHRPRRGRRAFRARGRRPHRRRRHRHGDDRLRHPRRARAQAPARQDRHLQRTCAGHRRPLRLPGARPVVPEDGPGPAGLGRRPAAPLARGAHARGAPRLTRSSASRSRPTRTSRGPRCRRAARSTSGATTSTGRASTWCRGSDAGCAASPPATTWRRRARCRPTPSRRGSGWWPEGGEGVRRSLLARCVPRAPSSRSAK